MPSEPKDPGSATVTRPLRSALLRKQPEIEEVDEEDTSPSSDQSDSTITAGGDTPAVTESDSQENGSPDDLNTPLAISNKLNHISPKIKQLTRSEALCEDSASPPLDISNLKSTASTCSSDSSSSGIGTKSSFTSGSLSGTSFHGLLEKSGSQSSEAGTSSSLSRDSSVDTPYKDSTGIDLEDFIRKTLNKTPKDRSMLIKLEVDLLKFIREPKHHYLKFPQMSSYDRMLVHRISAFFGLDHNVDQTGKCVIVNKTANTRIPEFSFHEQIAKADDSKPMMLLKRGGNSFDDNMGRKLQKPNIGQMNKAKSLEERQQIYSEARNRIFDEEPQGYSQEDVKIVKKLDRPQSLGSSKEEPPWSSCDSSGYGTDTMAKTTRVIVPKANSFGGTGTFVLQHMKSPQHNSLSKADSMSMGGYGLQPSFNNLRPLLRSSPTQCSQSDISSISGSSSRLAPSPKQPTQIPQQQQQQPGSVPSPGQRVYWVASDLNSVPPGSMLINPQTGQPIMNPDGTMHKFTPGQPLPQQAANYTANQQQAIYQTPQDWMVHSQDSQEMCQQLSVMRLTPQSSVESGGGGDGVALSQQKPVLINQGLHQQPAYIQQPIAPQTQGVYYQGSEGIAGQQGVRFMCSMNYQSPTQGVTNNQTSYSMTPAVVVDGNNQAQPYPTHQYCQQFVQNYPGNQMYSLSSQGGGQTVGCQGQSCDYSNNGGGVYSVTSPVDGSSSCVGAGGGYCYPVSYSQPQANQSQMYYNVQTPQSTPTQAVGAATGTTPHPYIQYSGQQGTTYQTNTSPPSQNSSVTPSVHHVDNTQTVNMNNLSSMNGQQQQQYTPTAGNVQPTAAAGQFVASFPSSHPMMAHNGHYHQPQQAFNPSPIRPVTPQMVPMPGVAVHGQTTPMAQAFHSVYRPNMQMPMQIYPAAAAGTQQATQPLIMAATTGINKPVHHGAGQQSSHVTVSAKGLQCEGKAENDDMAEVVTLQGSESLMGFHPLHNQGEIRLQHMSVAGRAQVQTVRLPHQSQTNNRSCPTAPKHQRPKKLRSRDSENSLQFIDSGCGNGLAMNSNVLEVCDLPATLPGSEIYPFLIDLRTTGGAVKWMTRDESPLTNVNILQDFLTSPPTTMSVNLRVFAVFKDSRTASQILSSHSNLSYKLRSVKSISEPVGKL